MSFVVRRHVELLQTQHVHQLSILLATSEGQIGLRGNRDEIFREWLDVVEERINRHSLDSS